METGKSIIWAGALIAAAIGLSGIFGARYGSVESVSLNGRTVFQGASDGSVRLCTLTASGANSSHRPIDRLRMDCGRWH